MGGKEERGVVALVAEGKEAEKAAAEMGVVEEVAEEMEVEEMGAEEMGVEEMVEEKDCTIHIQRPIYCSHWKDHSTRLLELSETR